MDRVFIKRLLTVALFVASVALFCLLMPSLFEEDSNLLIRAVLVASGAVSWLAARSLYRSWRQ